MEELPKNRYFLKIRAGVYNLDAMLQYAVKFLIQLKLAIGLVFFYLHNTRSFVLYRLSTKLQCRLPKIQRSTSG